MVLHGLKPGGLDIAGRIYNPGVYFTNSFGQLHDYIKGEGSKLETILNRINSIIVAACPGDDLSDLPNIYRLAQDINVLLSIVVLLPKNQCLRDNPPSALTILQNFSDMLILTSDETYLQYMIECLSI